MKTEDLIILLRSAAKFLVKPHDMDMHGRELLIHDLLSEATRLESERDRRLLDDIRNTLVRDHISLGDELDKRLGVNRDGRV